MNARILGLNPETWDWIKKPGIESKKPGGELFFFFFQCVVSFLISPTAFRPIWLGLVFSKGLRSLSVLARVLRLKTLPLLKTPCYLLAPLVWLTWIWSWPSRQVFTFNFGLVPAWLFVGSQLSEGWLIVITGAPSRPSSITPVIKML